VLRVRARNISAALAGQSTQDLSCRRRLLLLLRAPNTSTPRLLLLNLYAPNQTCMLLACGGVCERWWLLVETMSRWYLVCDASIKYVTCSLLSPASSCQKRTQTSLLHLKHLFHPRLLPCFALHLCRYIPHSSLSLSHTHTHTHSLSHSLTLSLTHTHTHTHTLVYLSLFLMYAATFKTARSLSLSLSLALSLLSLSLSHVCCYIEMRGKEASIQEKCVG